MDTLTHALSGALLTRVIFPVLPPATTPGLRRAMVLGGLCAAFPDSDVVIRFFSDQLTYLNLHRGVTHSLLMLPLWGILLATLFSLLDRHRRYLASYLIVAMAGVAIHITGDVITTYGTQILAPFSTWKASLHYTFIIDLWFSGIIVAGLLLSWRWRSSSRPAQLALLTLACYVGFQALQHGRAVTLGEQYAQQHGIMGAKVTALPQPLSPFNWKIVVATHEDYTIAYVNLWRANAPAAADEQSGLLSRIDAIYQPAQALAWQQQRRFGNAQDEQLLSRELWLSPEMAPVRRFIELPALAQISQREVEGSCAWFDDLRFTLSELRTPFRFGACRSASRGDVRIYRLSGDHLIPL